MQRESVRIQENSGDYINASLYAKIKTEVWLQDPYNPDLWHGTNGVIVNSEALEYREEFFEIIRKYH